MKYRPIKATIWALILSVQAFAAENHSSEGQIPRAVVGMDAYYSWMQDCLKALEADLPAITASAEAAAKKYLQDDWFIIAAGDMGVVGEAVGRSGGMMRFRWGSPLRDYAKRGNAAGRVVLIALRDDHYETYLKQAKEMLADESIFVVLMGPKHLLERAKADGFPMASSFENHAVPSEGLFDGGEVGHVVATSPFANIVALWVWKAEFVAACTRLGKMPVMYQSYAVPGARERAERLKDVRFEAETPQPVEAGVLGRAFLQATTADLENFYRQERENLAKVAVMAADAIQAGQVAYAFLHGHAIVMHQLSLTGSPGYFKQINRDWHQQDPKIKLQPGDFVFCIGYAVRFHDGEYNQWDVAAREAGATLAWSFTDYNPEEVAAVRKAGEVFVNQHWDYGDAVVTMPGYDLKIFPTSGVIAQAVLRLTEAGVFALNQPEGWTP